MSRVMLRNVQRTTLLAALALLLGTAACGSGDAASKGPPDGARLFVLQQCSTCHATDGRGGPLGPPLRHLEKNWTRESIAEYLADPKAKIASDGRMKALALNFRMPMPPVRLDLEQRLMLADHALKLSAEH